MSGPGAWLVFTSGNGDNVPISVASLCVSVKSHNIKVCLPETQHIWNPDVGASDLSRSSPK
jgi:hypothetical protein